MSPEDLKLDKRGIQLEVNWATLKRIFAWVRTTVITLGIGGGGYHMWDSRNELSDIKVRLAKCEEIERRNSELMRKGQMMPGNNPGSVPTGPPLVAPDFTIKVAKDK